MLTPFFIKSRQVDVVPLPDGRQAVGVNYFREGASFLGSPVSPIPPMK